MGIFTSARGMWHEMSHPELGHHDLRYVSKFRQSERDY